MPPDIDTIQEVKDHEAAVGEPVVFECDARGDPPPEVPWSSVMCNETSRRNFTFLWLYVPLNFGFVYNETFFFIIGSHVLCFSS